jgi:uncharacterized SAM-binding protein YcdF (DUF218 family)
MLHFISKLGWLLLTPSNFALLLLLIGCAFLALSYAQLGRWCIGSGIVFLTLCTVLPVGTWLLLPLENRFKPTLPATVDGIIVLGGATQPSIAAARDTIAVNDAGERPLALAALAHRYPSARLVFSGGYGQLPRADVSEADVVRRIMTEVGVDPSRIQFEDRSRNTIENVVLSKTLVSPAKEETWVLVTSAFHMPRAMAVFSAQGWAVHPYPVDFRTTGETGVAWTSGLSMASRLAEVDLAVREYIGLVVYRLLRRTYRLMP